jgi:dTDP-4-amino-4,6-dideoxygalactose transaminase
MFTKFKIEIILGFILVLFISGLLFLIKSTHQENTALKTETIAQQLKLSENEASFNTLIKTEDIANKVSQLKDHGASKSDLQRHKEKGGSLLPDFTMRGYNYRMTDMQGALGVCQMDRKEYIMNGRREVASKYDIVLKDISQLLTPYIPENYKHGYQSYVCIFTDGEDISNLTKEQIDRINIKRNIFMEKLEEMTIATRQGTHAVHTLGYYKNKNNFKDEDFLMSYAADRLSIALPLYAGMTNEEFDYVISNIKEALK